ncbi:MAG: hypothetical protein HRU09_18635 [Oligoflexales bacterium]|nr:hypothetical protein [Oligoflexales bacterium]
MKTQKHLVKIITLVGVYACTTPARHSNQSKQPGLDHSKSRGGSGPLGTSFSSDPTLSADYSPLRLSNETCRENQSYILKDRTQNQVEFGFYQNFSFNNLSFNQRGFFAGYRCNPQP